MSDVRLRVSRCLKSSNILNLKSEISHPLKDPARRRGQVVDNRVGGLIRAPPDLGGAGAGPYEKTARSDRPREAYVDPLVADDERSHRIETEIAGGAIDQAASGLSAVARARVLDDTPIGMV